MNLPFLLFSAISVTIFPFAFHSFCQDLHLPSRLQVAGDLLPKVTELLVNLQFYFFSENNTFEIWDFSKVSSRKCRLNTEKMESTNLIVSYMFWGGSQVKHRVFTEISEATVLNPATNSTMENVSGRKISIDGAIETLLKPRLSNWRQHLFLEYIQHKGIFWNINFKYQYYYTEWSTNTDDYLHIYDIRKNMPTFLPSPLEPMLIRVALETRKVQFVI